MSKIIFVFFAFLLLPIEIFSQSIRKSDYQALQYRNIGPSRGGRSSAVAGVPTQPYTFYMGNSGGVWKTVNSGQIWENISDKFFETGSIGAIAVADTDPNVVYVGTGQSTIRGNVSLGVGMYKSTDAGKTWNHCGLRKVGQIARVRIDPTNADLVYVAAIGHPFAPNEERGIYRSKDGCRSWEKVLYVSPKTGMGDLAMDRTNPRILYAAAWTVQRKPWTIISGSEEGALYKTTDGGDTWKKLSGGLPQGIVGKIGVDVSPAKPERVWAIVEHENGGVFRSDDAGESWQLLKTTPTRRLYQRAWYYMHIHADPEDPQKVYILNVDQFRSRDGGVTYEEIQVPHGDGHDLWINPNNTSIMVMGTDGGGSVTFDEGKNWSTLLNQPTAEIYFVTVDNQFPYRVYGAQQDNSTISITSRSGAELTPFEDWRDLGGGESGHIGFKFSNPDIVYAGSYGGEITRLNHKTAEFKNIMAYPQMEVGLAPKDLKYRFNWNAPIRVSRHNEKEIYMASQYIHRTTDEGHSWEVISPDLSRNDKTKQDYSGEPITKENTGIEVYSNVLSFEESPVQAGIFWVGSDDGLVHVSEDHGKTWRNVTPSGMPEWGSVNSIEPSTHDPARAIITVLKHRLGDFHPYIYSTNNFGKTWSFLSNGKNGIASDVPARVVREDPHRKGLLYAGTENGMYFSRDDGSSWQTLQLNLPVVPITDIKVHQNDLVLSTQGRSFWILDDVTVLHQLVSSNESNPQSPSLLKPRDTYRMRMGGDDGDPPNGVLIFYKLPAESKNELKLEIRNANGDLIQTFSSERPPHPNPEFPYSFMGSYSGDKTLQKKAGLNRFVWDMRYPVVDYPPGTIVWGFLGAPRVAPGAFSATLISGDWKQSQTFQILKDPRASATQQDLDEQAAFALRIRDRLNQLYKAVRTLRTIRTQAQNSAKLMSELRKPSENLDQSADELSKKLSAIEEELMQPKNEADQDTENFPTKIDNQLAYVYMHLNYTDSKPTEGQKERIGDLEKELEAQLARVNQVISTDVPAFNKEAAAVGAPIIITPQ